MPDFTPLFYFAMFGFVVAALLLVAAICGVGYLLYLGVAAVLA